MSLILGIETSCDETAAAVVENGTHVRSNIIATQHELHERYAGVVPEIASRAHLERIVPVIREALEEAKIDFQQLDAIAVGHRPGLIGSLLVGVSAAKSLAWSLGVPLIGVDHLHAHLFAGLLEAQPVQFPALGLVVSGGHTSLFYMTSPLDVQLLGRTIDDAVGEAFDKAATILGLSYPGGPQIDSLAQSGRDDVHDFPITLLDSDSLDFSFSGLKTSLLYSVCGQPIGRGEKAQLTRNASSLSDQERADFAASFQRTAIDTLMKKLHRAYEQHSDIHSLLIGGGVSANSRLRKELKAFTKVHALDLRLPKPEFCLDNAAMIAGLAACKLEANLTTDFSLTASTQTEFVS